MKKFLKRIGIVLIVITFPIWILPLALIALGLNFLEEVFNIKW